MVPAAGGWTWMMGRVALRSSLVGRCGFVVDECILWNEFVPTERIHSLCMGILQNHRELF